MMPETKKELVEFLVRELESREGIVGEMVKRHVERCLPGPHEIQRQVDQAIAGGWREERRQMFLAGAEWAQQFIAEMPREFYKLANQAAAEALER